MAVKNKREKMSSVLFKGASSSVKEELQVDPELENLIPPLTEEELTNLEASIKEEGCREPLIVWQSGDNYVLVDGHNRYRLCQKNKIEYNTKLKSFNDKSEVKDWVLANQMSRRNLSPLQLSYLRGLRYANEKQSHGGKREKPEANGQNVRLPMDTSEKLSEEFGVNEKTIRRDARFASGLNKLAKDNQQLRWQILNGRIQAKKSTVSDLANQDEKFLDQLKAKLSETNHLENALKLMTIPDSTYEEPEESAEFTYIYRKMLSLLRQVKKLDKHDPKRKESINELREVTKEFWKVV